MKRFKMCALAAGLACAVALAGCSVSSESTTETEVSTTTDGKTETTTTTTTEADGEQETTSETNVTLDINDWTDAWAGASDAGFDVYYAQAPEGTAQAFLVIYDPESETLETWVGDYEVPEDGFVELTDAGNGAGFAFAVVEQDESSVTLDLGEEYGIAELSACDIDEALDAISEVDVNGQFIG